MVIEVRRGQPTPEELAAVTAVLMARAAAAQRVAEYAEQPRFAHGNRRPRARWRRPERVSGYRNPVSWR